LLKDRAFWERERSFASPSADSAKRWGSGTAEPRRRYAHKKSGGNRLPPLVNSKAQGLSSAASLAAALLPAAALLAAALFVAIGLLAATALSAATALLAALLSGSRRFDRFVRIALCFHDAFLYCLIEFTDWSFALRDWTFSFFQIGLE
jgi:hypothetical protein